MAEEHDAKVFGYYKEQTLHSVIGRCHVMQEMMRAQVSDE